MKCPRCEKEINEQSKYCQYCGFNIKAYFEEDDKTVIILVILLLVLLIGIFILMNNEGLFDTKSPSSNNYTYIQRETNNYPPSLEVLDSHFCAGNYGVRSICGTIINNGSYNRQNIMVNIILFDSQGYQIGDTTAIISTLAPNAKWKFQAPILQPNVAKYKITSID